MYALRGVPGLSRAVPALQEQGTAASQEGNILQAGVIWCRGTEVQLWGIQEWGVLAVV